ncbi:T9SS type A sorting domain-containing protein [Chitinophagaceae bacterium LB-8]|uniref:T9SS type A sorting domain-containing protein n=1 Tax=Paraflavisolibacter caeni TaxID=2982496 RepID=A0A9X2XRP7_9BACT|nr:T9SS type A sorting domain-containing protein [Paraflavisolibacter caeni]MCU7547489.1 T9SS type A sorting domain-containing protein [Paraflavisolibacter caeni]
MKKILSTIVLSLAVLFGNSQRFLWFNELVPDPGSNEDEYVEFFNTSPLTIFLDCYVVVSYFDNGTDKGVYVYNFPTNAAIKGLSYYLISSNNPVRYKSNTNQSFTPTDLNSFSNWNDIGSGGYISKYTYSNNQWSGPTNINGNFRDFMNIQNGNDASLLLYKINSNGTTSIVNGFFANSSLSVPTKITSLTTPLPIPPGSICANTYTTVNLNFTGITTNNVDVFQVQSAAGNSQGYAKLSNGLCGNWKKTQSKGEFTPGESNTLGGATSSLTTTQSYICNTVSFSITPGSSTTYPINVQLFNDNPTTNVFAENDVLNASYPVNSAASTSSTFNVPSKQPVFLIYQSSSGCFDKIVSLTSECSVLPVHFSSFTAARNPQKKEQVLLKWQTASEQNNRGFNVQRKIDGQWKNIAFVFSQAENGNSNSTLTYEYKDPNVSNTVTQYQIQQVDFDGKTSYSDIKSVIGQEQKSSVLIYPNPAVDGKIKLLFIEQGGLKDVIVSDVNGRPVKQFHQLADMNLTIEGLKSGFYTIKIIDRTTAKTTVEKVIIK